jgi:hypothetical protein
MNKSKTPETDVFALRQRSGKEWINFARKLEVERDEARKEADGRTEIANAMTDYAGNEAAV